jgi:UDP-2,3-diacylglucosamine hydrolase
VAHYFASDIHLRCDRPERDRRFCHWLGGLAPTDVLVIAGDLCDFWMSARPAENPPEQCQSLRALAAFSGQGGTLEIMVGNHDAWLGPYYERALGARIVTEPLDLTLGGLRVRVVHGHRFGVRKFWKAAMESRAFWSAFGFLPGPIARRLDQILAWRNDRSLLADEERHLRLLRACAAAWKNLADIVVFGHVHRPLDETQAATRLVVLGGWEKQSSYLRIDEAGATFHIVRDHIAGIDPATVSERAARVASRD